MIMNGIYNQTISLLLDEKAALGDMLSRMKEANGESTSYKTLCHTVDVINHTISYIRELETMVERIDSISYRNQDLERHSRYLHGELQKFIVIERQVLSGTLDQITEVVQAKIIKERTETNQN